MAIYYPILSTDKQCKSFGDPCSNNDDCCDIVFRDEKGNIKRKNGRVLVSEGRCTLDKCRTKKPRYVNEEPLTTERTTSEQPPKYDSDDDD